MELKINPEEVISIIKRQLREVSDFEIKSYGIVLQIGDNIAKVWGLKDVRYGELVKFPGDVYGLAFDLEEETVGVIMLGEHEHIREGDRVEATGRMLTIPVGKSLLGRVIDPLGNPLDDRGPIEPEEYRPLEALAPGVVDREPVNTPLYTGIKAIDALIPIGRGQRELIIGDRSTGKTAIVIDTIINQKDQGVYCIYVAIGQKASTIAGVIETLKKYGAMDYTVVVAAPSSAPPSMLYLAPYAGCAIGEYFMYRGEDALVIYDDLSKHAKAYREISLLLRRPPGREAYPGDVFYLHSRLLERSAKLNKELGGGSLTALPIIETQLGDVSAYIPTNVISITDGQIYLDTNLFNQGFRPAIDVGLSVSRVGGSAQIKATKQVAGQLRLDLAQFRELAAFVKFASELDPATQLYIIRGQRLMELLKQDQFKPMPIEEQIISIFAGVNGYLDDIPVSKVREFEEKWLSYVKETYPNILSEIREKKHISDELFKLMHKAIREFRKGIFKERDEETIKVIKEAKGPEYLESLDKVDEVEEVS